MSYSTTSARLPRLISPRICSARGFTAQKLTISAGTSPLLLREAGRLPESSQSSTFQNSARRDLVFMHLSGRLQIGPSANQLFLIRWPSARQANPLRRKSSRPPSQTHPHPQDPSGRHELRHRPIPKQKNLRWSHLLQRRKNPLSQNPLSLSLSLLRKSPRSQSLRPNQLRSHSQHPLQHPLQLPLQLPLQHPLQYPPQRLRSKLSL